MSVPRRSRLLAALTCATVPALAALLAVGTTATAASPSAGAPVQAAPPPLTTDTVASGLVVPWDVGFLPDGRMLVTEREGRIRVYSDGSPGATVERTLTVPDIRLKTGDGVTGEAGVMGIAVDTDFARHPYVYVCASRDYAGSGGWVNEVLRYSLSNAGVWSGPTVVLTGMRAGRIHNGCALEMDQDGLLWAGMGDAGSTSFTQDRSSLNGKILRMTRTGGVPADNPSIDGVTDVVYALGFRNPQGLAFEPGTGRVYSVEHGPARDDEVNLLQPGGNYGWPCYTGDGVPNDTRGCGPAEDYLPSAWASGSPTIATSGGSFVRGAQWQDHEGDLFVPTLKQMDVRRFDVDAAGALGGPETMFDATFGRLRAAVTGPGGRLFLTTSNGNDRVVRVSPAETALERVGGADRYAVAAEVSERTYPDGAAEVVVATGAVYPDALAGSAVGGGRGMPVLLTRGDAVPPATRAELERLAPERVWVLGGPASVSEAVRLELADLAASGQATRIGGPDRYAVAAGVSGRWFDPGTSTLFVASGEVFPDALAAGPAAAKADAPLLLVRRDSVPTATVEEVKRLAPSRVYVLGGENTITNATVQALRQSTTAPVTRLDGVDRYAVARRVAQEFWSTADADVASGQVFADGLTGGASAGHRGVPLLLTSSGKVPAATGQELLRLAPTSVRVLGGTATVPVAVFDRYAALVGAP